MRLRHIEVFNAVMVTGSVSGAARLINITQPAVSRTLKHAELQLGFPLFERAGGRLVATAEARSLFPLVEKLFSDLDEVRRLAQGQVPGTLAGLPSASLAAIRPAVQGGVVADVRKDFASCCL